MSFATVFRSLSLRRSGYLSVSESPVCDFGLTPILDMLPPYITHRVATLTTLAFYSGRTSKDLLCLASSVLPWRKLIHLRSRQPQKRMDPASLECFVLFSQPVEIYM